MLSPERLETLLADTRNQVIALVGDLFLDRYLQIEPGVHEVSIETGLEAYQVATIDNGPGALGTVMNNLAALGVGRLLPVTVIGQDGHGDDLLRALSPLPADTQGIVRDPKRLTPTYTKPMAKSDDGAWRELNRLDVRTRGPLQNDTTDRVIGHLRAAFERCDALIVSDQISEENWGVVNQTLRDALADIAQSDPRKPILIDSRARIGLFSCGWLNPNLDECLAALGDQGEKELDAKQAALQLHQHTGRPVFCTRGEHGMWVVQPDGEVSDVPGYPVSGPIDIVGAGDSATAGIVAALLGGATPREAAAVGNLAASITIQQIGTTGTATPAAMTAAL